VCRVGDPGTARKTFWHSATLARARPWHSAILAPRVLASLELPLFRRTITDLLPKRFNHRLQFFKTRVYPNRIKHIPCACCGNRRRHSQTTVSGCKPLQAVANTDQLQDFNPESESWASAGASGEASSAVSGSVGLQPLPEPAAPPLLMLTIVP
jgi:hypothetical protein